MKGSREELDVNKSSWKQGVLWKIYFIIFPVPEDVSSSVRKVFLTFDIPDSLVDIQVTDCCVLRKQGYNPEMMCCVLGQSSSVPLYDPHIPEPELISFGSLCNPRREVCAAECNSHRSEIGLGNDSMALPVSFHVVKSRFAAETGWQEFSSTQICVTSLGFDFLVLPPVSDKDRHLLTLLQKQHAFSESWEDQVRTKICERLRKAVYF